MKQAGAKTIGAGRSHVRGFGMPKEAIN